MFDFPRPAHAMSARPNVSAAHPSRMAVGAAALALAATVVAGAAPRHPAHATVVPSAHAATQRHTATRQVAERVSKKAAPAHTGRVKTHEPATGYVTLASVSRHSSAPARLHHGAEPRQVVANPAASTHRSTSSRRSCGGPHSAGARSRLVPGTQRGLCKSHHGSVLHARSATVDGLQGSGQHA